MNALVVCPTYGRIPYLSRMLSSFVNQSYDDKQLVIINDDNNVELCCNYPNVLVINYPKRLSVSDKRNLGISLTDSDIIFPLDDDDIFTPDRIENHLRQYTDPNVTAYRNISSYIIYGDIFKKSDESPHNSISYRKNEWYRIGGYFPGAEPREDVDFFNKVSGIKNERDESKKDFIYGFGGVNYHTCCVTNSIDIDIIAYKQLKNLGLLGKKYWIEPDLEQYNICLELKKRFDLEEKDIKIKHLGDARIELLS